MKIAGVTSVGCACARSKTSAAGERENPAWQWAKRWVAPRSFVISSRPESEEPTDMLGAWRRNVSHVFDHVMEPQRRPSLYGESIDPQRHVTRIEDCRMCLEPAPQCPVSSAKPQTVILIGGIVDTLGATWSAGLGSC